MTSYVVIMTWKDSRDPHSEIRMISSNLEVALKKYYNDYLTERNKGTKHNLIIKKITIDSKGVVSGDEELVRTQLYNDIRDDDNDDDDDYN